jgi:xanthine dehydrogenase YagT iron-sulfur-binding subunit
MKTEAPSESATEATWTTADGDHAKLSDFRGSPVVFAFLSAEWDPGREHQLEIFRDLVSSSASNLQFERTGPNSAKVEASVEGQGIFQVPVFDRLDPESSLAQELGVYKQESLVVVDGEGFVACRLNVEDGRLPLADELMAALNSHPKRNVSRRQFTAVATFAALMLLPRAGALPLSKHQLTAPGSSAKGKTYTLHINGRKHEVPADSRITVLNALRDYLGLTGTKKGCDHGQCGACTIHLNGRRVNSCLVLAAQAEGAEIRTIEGLARGEELHPVQQAFIEHDGFQCGYCTPGQIMSAVACIREGHTTNPEEIREWMSGNICRCGAYQGILEAVQSAKSTMGAA